MVVPKKILSVPKLEIGSCYLLCRLFAHCFLASYVVHAIPKKSKNREEEAGRRGDRGHANYTGVLKKEHEKIPGVN